MTLSTDSIAAITTPPGKGGVGIVRVSGNQAQLVAQTLLGFVPHARHAELTWFLNAQQEKIDQGIAIYYPGPNSYTGEDVLELQGHGGPVVMQLLLNAVLDCGVRLAEAGEFTQRAFLNDKMDLAQAEAVADLIDSGSAQAAQAAVRSLQGVFSVQVNSLVAQLIDLRAYVEAALDFPEEEIDFLATEELATRFSRIKQEFNNLQQSVKQGALLREGLTAVIVGKPNAGKSSLMNRLAGYEAAIVTDIPGTTRDVLKEQIVLDGLPLHIIDTAGLRESEDVIEQEGIRRAHSAIESADVILQVVDVNGVDIDHELELDTSLPILSIYNKIDLGAASPEDSDEQFIYLSALTGEGLDKLITQLKRIAGFQSDAANTLGARTRHLNALNTAQSHIDIAFEHLSTSRAGELVAEELRLAQEHMSSITGEFTSDDLLGKIFGSFCIGK
ncbi:MAG: tRNA uridine-5-carboxymethylaminomethyl(34) synthesis GTPase MnmE [Gammaproteobacteria bacterium]|nr:tRNA uridine-5-carboxymethylaminomethyl(34) synthesis GTPase MnmE [Gammaproteobacteria bacterium]NNC96971.1 tRNA uridine-5-carboxymethylaminomethyl(34) synthesis GTPase MnmE [Gammaproteobacteria bacterium]NNM13416.1 tRNA uridine-5-carboxymethylaminomethyl(34) synthesis GTPase MnmE [Gammaproteobacteria bacterium]